MQANQVEQVVAPNRSLVPCLKSTTSVRGSEDFLTKIGKNRPFRRSAISSANLQRAIQQ